ncbi:hypothetical protein DMH03_41065 [Amycolatopsis sp. WAC 01376]|uniref:hypothetical protein n=1 Tax=Amycolatopsis sp. WAC 01376 TaxID=2203195 RepID=UPI000F798A29|nr:hypothetical protein [Amycolatopsis sp. WAC 01376]RSM52260.1 hypothetical protein DMH03_41065 [Amycolatopsis sp. WAC 01376]
MRKIFAAIALFAGCLTIGAAPANATQARATALADCHTANVQFNFDNWGSTGGFHAYCGQARHVWAVTAFYDSAGAQIAGGSGYSLVPADGQWHWLYANTSWGGLWKPVYTGCIWITQDNPSPGGTFLYNYCKNI